MLQKRLQCNFAVFVALHTSCYFNSGSSRHRDIFFLSHRDQRVKYIKIAMYITYTCKKDEFGTCRKVIENIIAHSV